MQGKQGFRVCKNHKKTLQCMPLTVAPSKNCENNEEGWHAEVTAVVLREEQLGTWPGRKGFKTLYLATLVAPVREGGNRNVVALIVNRRVWNAVLGCNLKNDRMISVHFHGKPFSITVIQVYAPTSNAEEAEQFYEDLQDLLELTPPKICPFHYRGLECKSRKSRNTWSNRQIWPWNTEWRRAKTNRVLPRKCTGHNKHPLPTTQEKTLYMDMTRWSTPK